MGLKVIGAGLPRTGTTSLKIALQILLNGRCYHMAETHEHPEHAEYWRAAGKGEPVDWEKLFSGYSAAVDTPTCHFWSELMQVYPEALVVLSVRDANAWFESCTQTIFKGRARRAPGHARGPTEPSMKAPGASNEQGPRPLMTYPELRGRSPFARGLGPEAIIGRYERHNEAVRAGVPPQRLLVWRPEDGWAPLCAALQMPVPDIPFPHWNTRRSWRYRQILRSVLGGRLADKAVRFMETQRARAQHGRRP